MTSRKNNSSEFLVMDRERSLIKISGNDSIQFFQGLTTNDVSNLRGNLIYSAILSPQGKYLFDFFVFQNQKDTLFVDIQSNKEESFLKFLEFYKLNSEVTFKKLKCRVVLGNQEQPKNSFKDPRSPKVGWRLYDFTDEFKRQEFGEEYLEKIRVGNCIPKTDKELIFQKTYILEAHFEKLKGVDFTKGCYIGQEVTARMKHKGTLKNLYYTAEFEKIPDDIEKKEVISEGRRIGEVYSVCYPFCIIRIRQEFKAKALNALGVRLKLLC